MSGKITIENFEYVAQQITEAVNARLIDTGQGELAIKVSQVQLEPGVSASTLSGLYLQYEVGDGLNLEVAPIYLIDSDDRLESFANDLAKALVNLDKARKFLVRYHRSVRAAAKAAVRSARESGYRIKLAEVALKRTYAFHLTHPKWREAADHILATINFEILRANGEPDEHYLVIEEPENVALEIESVLPG